MQASSGQKRNRTLYATLIALVIACGLLSRSTFLDLPPFWAKYTGDALWALMIFLIFAFLFPKRKTATIAALATALCLIVECSQLYHAPWLDALRQTWLGRMTLGNTFAWADLAAYLIGILTGSLAEWACKALSTVSRPAK